MFHLTTYHPGFCNTTNIDLFAETQELLDFCSQHKISADVEIIAAADINDGFERLERGDVRYRLAIDMATLEAPAEDIA